MAMTLFARRIRQWIIPPLKWVVLATFASPLAAQPLQVLIGGHVEQDSAAPPDNAME